MKKSKDEEDRIVIESEKIHKMKWPSVGYWSWSGWKGMRHRCRSWGPAIREVNMLCVDRV